MAGPALQVVNSGQSKILPFGQTPQGQNQAYELVLKNIGTADLTITGITLVVQSGNQNDFSLNGLVLPLVIAPGVTNVSVIIGFVPTSSFEMIEQALLTITSDSVLGSVQQYTIIGTSSKLGTSTNVNSTPISASGSVNQVGNGSSTTHSANVSFASTSVAAGSTVSVNLKAAGNFTLPAGSGGNATVDYSVNGGTTWASVAFYYGPITPFGGAVGFIIPISIANLDLILLRTTQSVIVGAGGTASAGLTISSITASITTVGDTFVEVFSIYPTDLGFSFPIANFGSVAIGTPYTSYQFNIYNPTSMPLTVLLSPDTGNGYSVNVVSGTNPIPAGNNLVFTLGLTPLSGGIQDDLAALVISIPGSSYSFNIESIYQAPSLASAFSLVGDQEQTVLALKTVAAASYLNYFDPSLPCEDVCQLARQYYFDQPQLNKNLNRIWLLYEQLGTVFLQCSASAANPKNTPVPTANLQTVTASDGKLNIGVLDLQISGSIIQLFYSVLGTTTAPFSIVGFVFKLDEGGEVIEGS